jgi:propionate CoA-transferase
MDQHNKVMFAEEAVQSIKTGDTISVCGISGGLTPDKVLVALGRRFLATGSPRDLTLVFPVAVGDAYEIQGLDHLAHEGMIKRLIGGSYTVSRSSEKPPKIYEIITQNKVEAYNFPMGVLMHLHREIAAKRPGLLTEVGLGTFVDPRVEGGRMNETTRADLVEVCKMHGRDYLFFPAFPINVALIRGTTADEDGNITMEHEYSASTVLVLAMAAHNCGGKVIAQVKRVAARGTMPPQMVKVPGIMVDAVVLDEHQKQTTGIVYDPGTSGEIRSPLQGIEGLSFNLDKILVRRTLMELKSGYVVNLGFGIPALIPQVAWEEGVFDKITFTTEHGCIGGMPFSGVQFGGSLNPQALLDSPAQFDFIDGGGPDAVCLAFAEVDREGNVNVTKLRQLPHVLAGAGGFINLIQNAKEIIFCGMMTAGGTKVDIAKGRLRVVQDGKFRKFVPRVQQITFNGQLARSRGQKVLYVTERGVFRLQPGGLLLMEVAPGVNVEKDIAGQIGFKLQVAPDLKEMEPELFRPERMGLSELHQWR